MPIRIRSSNVAWFGWSEMSRMLELSGGPGPLRIPFLGANLRLPDDEQALLLPIAEFSVPDEIHDDAAMAWRGRQIFWGTARVILEDVQGVCPRTGAAESIWWSKLGHFVATCTALPGSNFRDTDCISGSGELSTSGQS